MCATITRTSTVHRVKKEQSCVWVYSFVVFKRYTYCTYFTYKVKYSLSQIFKSNMYHDLLILITPKLISDACVQKENKLLLLVNTKILCQTKYMKVTNIVQWKTVQEVWNAIELLSNFAISLYPCGIQSMSMLYHFLKNVYITVAIYGS